MKRRTFVLSALAPLAVAACGDSDRNDPVDEGLAGDGNAGNGPAPGSQAPETTPARPTPATQGTRRDEAGRRLHGRDACPTAARYVWSYLPDLSPDLGRDGGQAHDVLDPAARHALGGPRAARRLPRDRRRALLRSRRTHRAGAGRGAASLRRLELHPRLRRRGSLTHWYETIGANGWRLEEFQHYYGNATFDDAGTAVASQLLLRMYLEKRDPRFLARAGQGHRLRAQRRSSRRRRRRRLAAALSAVADFGHRRCRRPIRSSCPPAPPHGMEDGDYTEHVTFNDDVAGENIKFLLMCVSAWARPDLVEPVQRAMECLRRLQQPAPQAGWGLQHLAADQDGRPAGAPAGARSYEPRALATHTTQTNVQQLFNYFRLTGDRTYLRRVPEAIAWLESCPADRRQKRREPAAGRPHAPDLRRTGHQPPALRASLRLQRLERRLLPRPRPPRHAEPLLGRPQHQYRQPAGHLRPAERDERRCRRRNGGALAAEGDAGPGRCRSTSRCARSTSPTCSPMP